MSWTSLSICGNLWTCHCRLSSLRSDCQFCCGEHNPKFHLLSAIRGKETQMSNKVRTSRSENVGPLLHGMPFEFGTQGSIQFFRESHDIVPRWVGIGIGDVFSGGDKMGKGVTGEAGSATLARGWWWLWKIGFWEDGREWDEVVG